MMHVVVHQELSGHQIAPHSVFAALNLTTVLWYGMASNTKTVCLIANDAAHDVYSAVTSH
jgi:hypothetical protein